MTLLLNGVSGVLISLLFGFYMLTVSECTQEGTIVTAIPRTTDLEKSHHVIFFNGTPYDADQGGLTVHLTNYDVQFYACDVDFARRLLYVFDDLTSKIYVFENVDINDVSNLDIKPFHYGSSSSVYVKIAVDWLSNNVYWTDPLRQWIAVQQGTNLNSDPELFDVIVDDGLDTPTGLAIDPVDGYLFWSNLGHSSTIERSKLTGDDRRTILSQGLGKPISIAVDHESTSIYWTDVVRHTVEKADYDGGNRKTIRRMSHSLFYDIALYKDSIIVTELRDSQLLYFNKLTGDLIKMKQGTDETFYGVKMFSSVTQPAVTDNQCLALNCEELCIGGGTSDAVCACRTGYRLTEDGRTCEEDTGKYHRAIVIADATSITMLHLHSLTTGYTYRPVRDIVSGTGDNSIRFFDVDSNLRYFVYATRRDVNRVYDDGQAHTSLFQTSETITGLTLDWVNQNIYWTMGDNSGHISFWSLSRSMIFDLAMTNLVSPRNIVVDPHESTLYWISGDSTPIIEKASTDGSHRTTLVTSGHLENPRSLILDYTEQMLYWSDEGYVRRCGVDGSNLEMVTMNLTGLFMTPDLLLVYKKYLVWTDDVSSNQSRINVFEKTTLPLIGVTSLNIDYAGKIVAIKAMDPVLQKEQKGPCVTNNGGCAHICIPVGQTTRLCQCEFGYTLREDKTSCFSVPFTDNYLLMTDWTHNKIYQVSLESGEVRGLLTGELGQPTGVTFDPVRQHVIWGESGTGLVRLMKLDGSVDNVLVYSDLEFDAHPDRFAIDTYSGNVYYTSVPVVNGGFVGVAVVTPEGQHRKIITTGDGPRAIVLDVKEGIMFWTDHGDRQVYKANLDGSDVETVAVATDLTFPNGIAIDHAEKQIYVTDGYTNKIHRCSYAGLCTKVYEDDDAWLMSIYLHGGFLYYTSWNNPFISRIDKATFTNKIRLSNNPELGRLDDIFVYSSSETQPPGHSICSANEGRGPCSTFCFPRGPGGYVCACEDGVGLTVGGHRCENVPETTTTITTTTTQTTQQLPTSTTTVAQEPPDAGNQSMNLPVIIGASAGGSVLVAVIIILVVCLVRNSRKKPDNPRHGFDTPAPATQPSRPVSSVYDSIDINEQLSRTAQTNNYTTSGITNTGFAGYMDLSSFEREGPTTETTPTKPSGNWSSEYIHSTERDDSMSDYLTPYEKKAKKEAGPPDRLPDHRYQDWPMQRSLLDVPNPSYVRNAGELNSTYLDPVSIH